MKRIILCAASLWTALLSLWAASDPNPYVIIAERNVFGLSKALVEEPPQLTKPPTEPEANLRLTGVAFLEGKRWALLIQEKRGQPPRHLTLQEGEKIDGLEVRQVDVERGEVLAIANGKDMRVSFAAQDTEMHAARQAEKQFVEEHTRAHEALQRRERERLARALNAP
jgi:type II secretory pathway component PulC